MTADTKPGLDLRTPGIIDSLVIEGRLPLIVESPSVNTENGSARHLVLVPRTALQTGDKWWMSMGGTYSIARRGNTHLEEADLFEVSKSMLTSIVQQIEEAQARRDIKA